MILGRGDIASVLTDRPDVTFMASGVSNSKETHPEPYQRELRMLMGLPKYRHLVYFSSLCIYYLNTEYARHKRIMEKTIASHFESYTIIRLGNIDWGKNPNTLINYLKAHPEAIIQSCYRHIISIDEFRYWVAMIRIGQKDTMNIPGRMVFVPALARLIKKRVGHDVLLSKAENTRMPQFEVYPNNIDL